MSTGGSIPYQLRTNKAIERLIFLDLLSRLTANLGISGEYDYFGFGGPQMEDFRLMYDLFPDMSMVSLERLDTVLKRQKFNEPHTNVECKLQTSQDFVNSFSGQRKAIVWLDYTSPSERSDQVEEFQTLLRRVKDLSIVKITIIAAVATLGGSNGPGLQVERLRKFLDDFSRCFPNGLEEEDVTARRFPSTLLRMLDYASAEALQNRPNWRFQPLVSATYADGQAMITVTGIVGPRPAIENLLQSCRLSVWNYARLSWHSPVEIEVPELTLKERIHVNQLLPKYQNDAAEIQRKIGIFVDETEEKSLAKLRSYISFYRHYPHFGKIAI
jgi:hypothetical protein